jgi:hypothetical protein
MRYYPEKFIKGTNMTKEQWEKMTPFEQAMLEEIQKLRYAITGILEDDSK